MWENAKEVRDSEEDLLIVDEVCNTTFKMANIKEEKDEEMENTLENSGSNFEDRHKKFCC